MKTVVQNTLFGILCLAGVVWAAPTQTVPVLRMAVAEEAPELSVHEIHQKPENTSCNSEAPSLLEGTTRFACW